MSGGQLPSEMPGSIRVDLMAMRQDAQKWAVAADRMAQAAATVKQLAIDEYGFSLLASQSGLVEAYSEMQAWVAGLLDGAQQNLSDMAAALEWTAENYRMTDTAGGRSFDRLRDQLEQGEP